jgi:DNA-binding HxlR family transcriptional regulator
MRTYGQYCSLAKALDLLGDRWTLLIVRELLLRGPCRYTDLRDGLPGIATNLLADRLRELQEAGVLAREEAPPPIATTLFSLTPRGEQLKDTLYELGRWGVPLMVEGPAPNDAFRSRWMTFPTELFLRDRSPELAPVTIEVRAGEEEPMLIETREGEVLIRPGSAAQPDAMLSGSPHLILALVSGHLELAAAEALGLLCEGSRESVMRVLPEPALAAADGGG